jgi:hypothetical protein
MEDHIYHLEDRAVGENNIKIKLKEVVCEVLVILIQDRKNFVIL